MLRAARKLAAKAVFLALAQLLTGAVKSVDKRVLDYEVAITELAAAVFNGNRTPAQFAAGLRSLIRQSAEQVYREGMEDGGLAAADIELDDTDTQIIDGWIADQLDYVAAFAADVGTATRANSPTDYGDKQQAIFDRAGAWAASLAVLGGKGLASAQGNMMVTWHYGDTEHCATCQRLNGTRRRLMWFIKQGYIPQEPGSETLDCSGYNCQCVLKNDKGKQVMP